MSEHLNGSNTLPRDFRFRYQDNVTTPEPVSPREINPPSPPRQRLKVRRRIATSLQAPTKQFLASVEAADLPLPTIEYLKSSGNIEKLDEIGEFETEFFASQKRVSSPKTPAYLSALRKIEFRPDWYINDNQEEYLKRSRSSHSISSDLSYESSCSNEKSGRTSDDGSCTSPDSECSDPFHHSSLNKNDDNFIHHSKSEAPTVSKLNFNIRKKVQNSAPWSKSQITHLWATYLLYLQDPTVTPFRIGASRVPPEGVCHRVAREARRSWKGPKTIQSRSSLMRSNSGSGSESTTPVEKNPRIYVQWPHSSSATRNKLRSICRHRDPSALYRFQHYLQSRSPTPFSRSTPCRVSQDFTSDTQESSLNIHDISISLSLSISESMQRDGVLAGLARDDIKKSHQSSNLFMPHRFSESRANLHSLGYRLGSPFSRTYGPSSTRINESMALPYSRNLGSPLQIAKSRSLNGIQRRRAQLLLREEYKPSSLTAKLNKNVDEHFESQNSPSPRSRTRRFSVGDETRTTQALHSALDLFPPPSFNRTWPKGLRIHKSGNFHSTRLRSPFAESSISDTLPSLHSIKSDSNPSNLLPASLHQQRRSIGSFDFGEEHENAKCQFRV